MATASTSSLTLTPEVMSSFRPSKVFAKHVEEGKCFTSLSFDDKGEYVITAAEDESMQLFNCRTGKHQRQLLSKKYGVHLARFTHSSNTIIHTSTKEDHGIRYLSLHDNNYLRYFKGHKKRVTALEMSHQDDSFLSASTDDTVRLWDLRSQHSQGMLNIYGAASVTYNPDSTVFAIATNIDATVLLYDRKLFTEKPFVAIKIPENLMRPDELRHILFTSVNFSTDGLYLVLGTGGEISYVVDTFDGTLVARLECSTPFGLERNPVPPYDSPAQPEIGISGGQLSWSPCSRFVISGSIDGKIHMWDVFPPPGVPQYERGSTLLPFCSSEGHVGGPSRVVAFNPRSGLIVSGGHDLAFWLPEKSEV